MKIIGAGKVAKDDQGKVIGREILVSMTEVEADQVTGIAGKPHIAGRYKPGRVINISGIYEKVERIIKKEATIKLAANQTKAHADDILNAFPIE